MSTGIFFHYQQGERLKDFPFDLEPIPIETLHKIHSPGMIDRVKATGNFEGALYSAAGTLSAAIKVWSGELLNAFVFTGYGDHHAGSNFFGGGCYLNGTAIAIHELQEKFVFVLTVLKKKIKM